MTKRERRRRSPDGLPIDAKEWTEADWRDLHEAMETVKRKVKARHGKDEDENEAAETEGEANARGGHRPDVASVATG